MSTDFLKELNDLEKQYKKYRKQAEDLHSSNQGKASQEEIELRIKAAQAAKQITQITDEEAKSKYIKAYNDQKAIVNEEIAELERSPQPEVLTESGNKGHGIPSSNSAQPSDTENEHWYRSRPEQGLDDVTGMTDVKTRLLQIIEKMNHKTLMEYLNVKRLSGFLLYGPPGCGKTFITEAFVHELMNEEYKYLSLDAKDIHSKYSGESEKTVGAVFEEVEKVAPAMLFFDEFDAVCTERQQPDLPQHTKSLTDAFLTAHNHLKKSGAEVFLIGATNYPQNVDSAMISRMELIRIPLPDSEARGAYLKRSFEKSNLHISPDLSVDYMAEQTENYSYRDLENLLEYIKSQIISDLNHLDDEEGIKELKEGKHPITRERFDNAFHTILPSYDEKYMKALEKWEQGKGIKQNTVSNSDS